MITVTAKELQRALYAANEVAKLSDKWAPALCQINLFQTTAGLIAESADRYSIVRALARQATPEATEERLGERALLAADDAKALLPLLKAQRNGQVSLEATEQTLTVMFDDSRGSTFQNNHADVEFPNLKSFSTLPTERLDAGGPLGMNPKFLAMPSKLVTLNDRKADPMVITNADPDNPNAGIIWSLGDWATGRIMNVHFDNTYGTGTENKLHHWLTAERI
ncbi:MULTISPECIES: hypothetical protein [Citricoccus]|uniref:hypothetical protein n=1 Tax=Citricoccus TaxID=169133 RepID=UPI000255F13A|nr:hypothetical protein [Citricoccus sp. CH26A]